MTAVPKMNVIRDKAYRESARDNWRKCMCIHPDAMICSGDVVLAHIRIAGNCGTGMKPSDDESLFLCHRHHTLLDQSINRKQWLVANIVCPNAPIPPDDTADYIVRYILIPQRKAAYRRWKAER